MKIKRSERWQWSEQKTDIVNKVSHSWSVGHNISIKKTREVSVQHTQGRDFTLGWSLSNNHWVQLLNSLFLQDIDCVVYHTNWYHNILDKHQYTTISVLAALQKNENSNLERNSKTTFTPQKGVLAIKQPIPTPPPLTHPPKKRVGWHDQTTALPKYNSQYTICSKLTLGN